ncbi:phage virion morphogenesis protein [Methylobacterium ajmalii]|uniref:Phage virion morphogenesis protein n=1 Tax=Methylobacterium ajmalii TaxID=2738439 RepID=A0ABV0A5Z0_9HYPH
MKISVRVHTRGLRRADKIISDLLSRVNNPGPVIEDIGAYMVRSIKNRIFSSKTDPDGKPWARNSDLTQKLKGFDSPLFHTGYLLKSIRVADADREGFTLSAADYGGYAQLGVKNMRGRYQRRDRKGIPARKFLGLSRENKVRIRKMLRDYILTGHDSIGDEFGG